MAINIDYDKLSLFHGFSKTPVSSKISLGNAINKAGHVVSSSEVWADEIPYFGKFGTTQVAHDTVSKDTTYGDMLFIGGNSYYQRNDVKYAEGKTFNELWTNVTSEFKDGYVFENRHGKGVIVYHQNQYLQNLNDDNNANTNSENCAARLWVFESPKDENGQEIEGAKKVPRLVEQFVGPTDRALNGLASVSYAPIVTPIDSNGNPGEAYKEGTEYSLVAFSGTILWSVDKANAVTTQDDGSIKSKFQISCFEYIGETLDKKIESISTTAKGGVSALSNSAKSAGFSITNPEGEPPTLDIATATIEEGIFATTAGNKAKLVTASDVENYVAKNAKVSVNGTSATKLTVNGTATSSNDLVKVVVSKDTTDGVALNLSATVDVASVSEGGEITTGDEGKLVTAIDAQEIASNVIDVSIKGTDSNTIGGKIKDIKDTVDDIENALSGVAQVVNDLEISTTQAISDAITESKEYTDSEINKIEQSISDALEAHSEDIAKVEAAIEGLTTTGLTRHVLPDGQTTANITDPQANVIYLVKDSTSETGAYVEYLYVNGDFEAIGTTSTDLSEYVKSVKINGSTYPANSTNKGALDLGTVVTGLYNSLPSGVTGVSGATTLVNETSVYAGISSGVLKIGVADATDKVKGLVQLSNSVSSSDTSNAITGKGVSEAISSAISDAELTFVDDRVETATDGLQDLWGTTVTKSGNTVKISHNYIPAAPKKFSSTAGSYIKSIRNNVAFYTVEASNAKEDIFANIQTDMIKNGDQMFYECNAEYFYSDLSSLVTGRNMFTSC